MSLENTPIQEQGQDANIPVIDTPQAAFSHIIERVTELSYFAPEGVLVKGGRVNAQDLTKGLEMLARELDAEDTDPNLAGFVTTLGQASAATKYRPEIPQEDPFISFLIARGSYRKDRPVNVQPEIYEEINKEDVRKPTSQGHQIIADGHVVRGSIVPGVGVQTDNGILRTRGNPQLR